MKREIYVLMSQKGGVTKTTTALNLAAARALEGKKTLFVDADPQATGSMWAETRKRNGISMPENVAFTRYTGKPVDMPKAIAAREFDCAVIDSPPRADEALSRAILASAQGGTVIVPMQASMADLWAAESTFKLIKEAQTKFPLKWAVLLTRFKPNTVLGEEFRSLLIDRKLPLLPVTVGDRVAFQVAMSRCQTIFEHEPNGKSAGEFKALLEAVKKLR